MGNPETTPLHEAVGALPAGLQAGVSVVLLAGLLVGLALLAARSINQAREATRREQDRHRRADVFGRRVHRGEEVHAPRGLDTWE